MSDTMIAEQVDQEVTVLVDRHLGSWSEPDAEVRIELVRQCWQPDGTLADPPLGAEGHDEISALMGTMQEHYPEHRFVRATEVDVHHDTFRVGWELRAPDGAVALAGVDFGLVEDGRLRRISGFFGELAPRQGEAARP